MYGQNIPSDRVVYKLNRGDVGNQVIEHSDGSKWSLFPGPKFQSTDQPARESLTAVSPSDMPPGSRVDSRRDLGRRSPLTTAQISAATLDNAASIPSAVGTPP
jgi:hypothetical protein